METNAQHCDAPDLDEPPSVLSRDGAHHEDAHWARAHHREHYYKPGLDYEDYAPAYCVGYIGHAQNGGRFEDAKSSLCANWERIKGDSRLGLDDALLAIRAAWDRMAAQGEATREPARQSRFVGLIRRYVRNPSFTPGLRLMR
jgi:hypothetical protein